MLHYRLICIIFCENFRSSTVYFASASNNSHVFFILYTLRRVVQDETFCSVYFFDLRTALAFLFVYIRFFFKKNRKNTNEHQNTRYFFIHEILNCTYATFYVNLHFHSCNV